MSDFGKSSNVEVEAEGSGEEEATTNSVKPNTSSVLDLMEEILSDIKGDLALEHKQADEKSEVTEKEKEDKNGSGETKAVSSKKNQDLKTKSSSSNDDFNQECPFKKAKLDTEQKNNDEKLEHKEKEKPEAIKSVDDPVKSDSVASSAICENQTENTFDSNACTSDFIDLESLRKSEIEKIIELASIDDAASQLTPDNVEAVMHFSDNQTKVNEISLQDDGKIPETQLSINQTNNISEPVLILDSDDEELFKEDADKEVDAFVEVYDDTQDDDIQFLLNVKNESETATETTNKSTGLQSSSVIEDIKEDLDASVIIVEPNEADDVVEQQDPSVSDTLSLIDDVKLPSDKLEEELLPENISKSIEVVESTITLDAQQTVPLETEATSSVDNKKADSPSPKDVINDSPIILDTALAETIEAPASLHDDKAESLNPADLTIEVASNLNKDKAEPPKLEDARDVSIVVQTGTTKSPASEVSIDDSIIFLDTAQADIIEATASLEGDKAESLNDRDSIIDLDASDTTPLDPDIMETPLRLDDGKAEPATPGSSIITLDELEESKLDSLNDNSLSKSNESIKDLGDLNEDFLDSSATTEDPTFFSVNSSTVSEQVEVLEQVNQEEEGEEMQTPGSNAEIIPEDNEIPKLKEKPTVVSSDTSAELNFQVCYNFKFSETGQIVNDSESLEPLIKFPQQEIQVEDKKQEEMEANIEEETLDASVSSNCAVSVIDLDEEIGDDDDNDDSTKENIKDNVESIKTEVDEFESDFQRLNEADDDDDLASDFGTTDEIDLEAQLMTAAADAEAAIEAYQRGEVDFPVEEQVEAKEEVLNDFEMKVPKDEIVNITMTDFEANGSLSCPAQANSAEEDVVNTPAAEEPETHEKKVDIDCKELVRNLAAAEAPLYKTEQTEESVPEMEEEKKDLSLIESQETQEDVLIKKEKVSPSQSPIPTPTESGPSNTLDSKDFASISPPVQVKSEVRADCGAVSTPKLEESFVESLLHTTNQDSIERPRLMSSTIDLYEENRLAKMQLLQSDDDDEDVIMDTQVAAAQRAPNDNTASNSFDEMDVEIPETPPSAHHDDSSPEIQENQENTSVRSIKQEKSSSSRKNSEAEKSVSKKEGKERTIKKPLSAQNLAKFNQTTTKRSSLSHPELNQIMTRSRSRTSSENVAETSTKSNQLSTKRKPKKKISLKAAKKTEADEDPASVLPNQLLAVISNLYLDSIERLKLDFPTRCARDLNFCKKQHFDAPEPNTPSNSQQQLMKCALQQQRYLIYVSIAEDMCHRREFPGERVLIELIELILSINSKTYNNEALQHLYIKCIETFRLIVRTFPPCWLALRPAYRNFFDSYLDKSKLYKNADIEDNPKKMFKTLLSILDETLEACDEEDLATNRFDTDPSQLSQPENLDQSEVFNQWEWEQQQNRFQTFEALTPANRLERIMVVLNLLLFILENDFSIWMLQHYPNPSAKIFETKTAPLMVLLFELTQYTRLTENVSKIFLLFAKAAKKNLNTSRFEILERYISLLMIASNTADLVVTPNGIKYPEVGLETKNLIKHFFKIFKANNLNDVNTYPKTIEMFRQPFLRYEFINKFLEIFYFQRSDELTPEKIKNEILKHKHFLKYRPDRELPDGSTDELSQQQYLNLLTIALKSYCDWHGCRTFLHVRNTGSEMPRVTTYTSTKYYQANGGTGKILLQKMESDINALNKMLRTSVKIALPKVDLPKADLLIDESTILKYQEDLTHIKLLQKYVPGLMQFYPDVDFDPLAEYLNTFVVYFNDE